MEMARLRNKLRIAIRGHKLLKDKSDEMTQQFLALIKQNRELRINLETQLASALRDFLAAQVSMTEAAAAAAIKTIFRPKIIASTTGIMGLLVPKLEYLMETSVPVPSHPNVNMQKCLRALFALLPDLINLAAIQKTCDCLAADIEKNRRRINALEYIMIPDTRETIKYIKMKLGENERQNIARLMKLEFKSEN